ncbi:dihydroxyacetone kinase subunit DhaL [Streptosporangium sp. NPDC048047]|uniref:dihydroxyacetone kinase subunit DhaL n=1 Tax=Streptosporangium sp. NPDC048047 TaxID=3155748 RepID=UPI0034204C35
MSDTNAPGDTTDTAGAGGMSGPAGIGGATGTAGATGGLDAALFAAWVEGIAAAVRTDRDRLTALDSAIGDADHGANLDRGFTAVAEALAGGRPDTPGALLSLVGNTLIRKVGGASGPLYGMAFREAGKALGDSPEVSLADLDEALAAGLAGIRRLGSAAEGDKTMVDALAPALRALTQAVQEGRASAEAVGAAAEAAEAGAQATVPMQARKGRASYLGPRSVGHEDPGAASTALIVRALHAAVSRTAGVPGGRSGPAPEGTPRQPVGEPSRRAQEGPE